MHLRKMISIATDLRGATISGKMNSKRFFNGALAVAFSLSSISVPSFAKSSAGKGEYSMNGYSASQFGDFAKDWKLVTVRFRKDTNEMRWTYANQAAWDTLASNKIDYPDGAVFAKVGVMTRDDLSFPSSAVPSGARRIQFMVRDKKKHADTDGWGYALFGADGKVFPGDQKEATIACAACHRLVPERGFVFSQIADAAFSGANPGASWKAHLKFESKPVASVPGAMKNLLKGKFGSVRVISGELSKSLFPGTLDEIRPLLAQEASRSKAPAALVEENGKRFSLVFPLPERGECAQDQVRLRGAHTVTESKNGLFEVTFCQTMAP